MYRGPNFSIDCDPMIKPNCKSIINNNENRIIVSAKDKEKCLPPSCFCEKGVLIKNGGFEVPGVEPGRVFADWEALPAPETSVVRTSTNVYQGNSAASIRTTVFPQPITRTVRLLQNVTVTPGCLYSLKFAERLVALGNNDTALQSLIARIFYVFQGFQYDLLNTTIQKSTIDRKYQLHSEKSKLPVPCNVSGVIVQFDFFITGTGPAEWNLDAVSMRAISKISACCCKE